MKGGTEESCSEEEFAKELQQMTALFSAGWLAAANLVGVWLAALLVRPAWGAFFGEWTYGRWMALHLNWHLYGWCSLPIVGLLLRRCLRANRQGLRGARWALSSWSFALLLGGVSWLQGESSGKLFLEWTGLPRLFFVAAMTFLLGLLAWNVFALSPDMPVAKNSAAGRQRLADRILVGALALVPVLLFCSANRRVYPSVDADTGGPTGASLLGSTLVIILILALIPKLLGLSFRATSSGERAFWIWFALDCGIFFLINRQHSSHRQWSQILGLGSLGVWVPLLTLHLQRFHWNPESRPWLHATLWWWGILVISGFASFLPGLLDRIKFTHALVAHAHLAMAGLLTSLNMLVLANLSPALTRVVSPLLNRQAFLCWHGGLLLQIVALCVLASAEIEVPGVLFRGGESHAYLIRLLAGLLMTGASVYWLAGIAVRVPRTSPHIQLAPI